MDAYDLILHKINLADFLSDIVELRPSPDGSLRGVCPLHDGANNASSFMVTPKNQTFYCNACGVGGNVIHFVMHKLHYSYHEAIEFLADYANIDLSADGTYQKVRECAKSNERTAQMYQKSVATVVDYLVQRRGLTPATVAEFQLGYDRDEQAIVIPIRDGYGRTVAFSRRYLNKEPKYRNSRNNDLYDKSKLLFNLDKARSRIKDRLYLVEGYMDAISAHQQGEAAVAYCASEPSKEQILLIKEIVRDNPAVTIMLAPDNDAAGQNKLVKVREKFNQLAPRLNVRVVVIPPELPDVAAEIKDFNDVVKWGGTISALSSTPINIHVLATLLDKCPAVQAEYLLVESYIKTVTNDMEKYDIAQLLSARWKKPLEVVYKYLAMQGATDEDILEEFKDVDRCMSECRDMIMSGGLSLGFPQLDASLKGVRKTDVILWGGYSGTFKTMYAMMILLHLAIRLKMNVLMFSLEMSAGAFYERLIANLMQMSAEELAKQIAEDEIFAMVYADIKTKLQSRLRIIDRNNLSLADIDRRVRIANARIWDEGQTDVIIIDYFQYLKGTKNYEEASLTARGLKELAKNNNLLVICLSQLSRAGNQWEKPTMQMLKGTGDLEASADILILAWRPDLDPSISKLQADELENTIGLFIAKGRRGVVISEFRHVFDKEKTKIMEITS